MNIYALIKLQIRKLIELLVIQNYETMDFNFFSIISCDDFKRELSNYGGRLIVPPVSSFDSIDIYEVDKPEKFEREYFVDVDLWIDEKQSDLTLSCEIGIENEKIVSVVASSLRVL